MKQCYLHPNGVSVILVGNHYFENSSHYIQMLITNGLVQEQDYTWSYYPAVRWTHDNIDQDRPASSYTEIKFQDPMLATFYSLKWK
jgi:hypothetical protein